MPTGSTPTVARSAATSPTVLRSTATLPETLRSSGVVAPAIASHGTTTPAVNATASRVYASPPASPPKEIVIAGETISALKPAVILDGVAWIASSADPAHRGFLAGIALNAATAGNNVTVQTAGRLQDDVWNWDTSKPWLFYGVGVLTQTPPAGWSQVIARVESSDTICICIQQGIER
jgi:hypothetical protein